MGGNECFFWPQHCWGKWGEDGMNPKPNKKLLLGAGSYVTIAWKGFFTQSQVLLSSIVAGFLALGIPERFCSYLERRANNNSCYELRNRNELYQTFIVSLPLQYNYVGFILFSITDHPPRWPWMSTYLKDWHICHILWVHSSATYTGKCIPGSQPKIIKIF